MNARLAGGMAGLLFCAGLSPVSAQMTYTWTYRFMEANYELHDTEEDLDDWWYNASDSTGRFEDTFELGNTLGDGSAQAEVSHDSFLGSSIIRARSRGRLDATAPSEGEASACTRSELEVEFTLDNDAAFHLKLDLSGAAGGFFERLGGGWFQYLDYSQQFSGTLPAGDYRLYLYLSPCQTVYDGDGAADEGEYDLTFLIEPETCRQSLYLPTFRGLEDMLLVGDAHLTAPDVLRLTDESEGQRGAAWYPDPVHLADGFDVSFQFRITEEFGSRGDGFAFVIQDEQPFAIGQGGSDLGYGNGITRSLAVEFDTFAFINEFPHDHVSVQTRGMAPNSSNDTYSLGHVVLPSTLADNTVHTCRLIYEAGVLTVHLDGMVVLSVPIDLQNIDGHSILSPEGCGRIGFTAGTGLASSAHDILNLSMNIACAERLFYPGFANAQSLLLVNDAGIHGGDVLRLTPAEGDRRGAAWHADTVHLRDGFTTEFSFRLSVDDPPADGLAWVIQGDGPDAIGGGGHDMGYASNPPQLGIRPYLAVAVRPLWWSPGEYEVKLETNLNEDATYDDHVLMAAVRDGILADGRPHRLRIVYVPAVWPEWGELQVYLDDEGLVLSRPLNLQNIDGRSILGPNGCAWVGFTAATGGYFSSHDILYWWLSPPCIVPPPGDFDGDCDVDQDDIAAFQACALGPAVTLDVGCEAMDLDGDGDADAIDFAILQRCYSGPGRPADPLCAGP